MHAASPYVTERPGPGDPGSSQAAVTSTADVHDRPHPHPIRRRCADGCERPSRSPGQLLLAVAVAVHAVVLWADPGAVLNVGDLPAGPREAVRVSAPLLAALLLCLQLVTLTGRLHRHRCRIAAWTAAWWMFAAVGSMLGDRASSVWLAELALAWLATSCVRILARAEARDLPSVTRGS